MQVTINPDAKDLIKKILAQEQFNRFQDYNSIENHRYFTKYRFPECLPLVSLEDKPSKEYIRNF